MRIIIKVGTQVVASKDKLNEKRIASIAKDIAFLLKKGHEMVLVTSGAIGAGLSNVSLTHPNRKKVAAAVGQPILMHNYYREFKKYKIIMGQILLNTDDLTNPIRFQNFVMNIEAMMIQKILPIINENDFMKTEDLTIGDNDSLSAKVAVGLQADKLIILTNINGLYTCNPIHNKDAKLIKEVTNINQKIENVCSPDKSELGRGGMISKIKAARYATHGGVETLVCNGSEKNIILKAMNGKNFSGTRFPAKKRD